MGEVVNPINVMSYRNNFRMVLAKLVTLIPEHREMVDNALLIDVMTGKNFWKMVDAKTV